MSLAEIHTAIPHRPPFLFVDDVIAVDENRIVCRKRFTEEDWFFAGHYPKYPVVPGVLLCEAALQSGAILMAHGATDRGAIDLGQTVGQPPQRVPVVTRISDVRFKQIVKPGDTIEIDVQLRERLAEATYFVAKVLCGGKLAARLEFACMLIRASESQA